MRRDGRIESPSLEALRLAIKQKNVQMLGVIRQELLSGIKEKVQFQKINDILSSFPDLLATSADHTEAANFFNLCRSKGVQGSPIDCKRPS